MMVLKIVLRAKHPISMTSGGFSHFLYGFLNLKPCFAGNPWFHPGFLPISPSAKHKDWKRYVVDKDGGVAMEMWPTSPKRGLGIGANHIPSGKLT